MFVQPNCVPLQHGMCEPTIHKRGALFFVTILFTRFLRQINSELLTSKHSFLRVYSDSIRTYYTLKGQPLPFQSFCSLIKSQLLV